MGINISHGELMLCGWGVKTAWFVPVVDVGVASLRTRNQRHGFMAV